MTKQFLITRPTHDKETAYLYSFSKAIVNIAKEDRNIRLTELSGSKAIRKNLEKQLSTKDSTLAFLNGHGDANTVFGHKDQPILDKSNIQLTKGKIVYALACDSLINLGKMAIKKGAKAYIGYTNEFMWLGEPSKSAVPDKDKNAVPFRKVCHILINSLLKGISVGEVVNKTKLEYKKLIKNYGNSEDDFGDAPTIGLALSWNLFALNFEGDAFATF